jgi:aromatic ring-opening dioxygenase catalytic subunit (LigB family)
VARKDAAGEDGKDFLNALNRAAAELRSLQPDVLVVCSADHFTNFTPNVYPQLTIGVGGMHIGPSEPWMGQAAHEIPGQPDFANLLTSGLMHQGFDPTTAGALTLDHGVMTVYSSVAPGADIPLVPFLQNTLVSPMSSLTRCYQMGQALRKVTEAIPADLRVGIIGAGGLSHWIGTSRDGDIDEDFDHWILERLSKGQVGEILDLTDEEIDHAGTGAHEIRSWLFAAGALSGFPAETSFYAPIPAWITGMAVQTYGNASP